MTIDPKTLPEGTVVEVCDGVGMETRFFADGGIRIDSEHKSWPLKDRWITRAFVPVPEGMSVEDAEKALADHVQWVPIPDGPTEAHEGMYVQARADNHAVYSGVLVEVRGSAALLSAPDMTEIRLFRDEPDWFIHPDDVPTDPDAELTSEIERVLRVAVLGSESGADVARRIVHLVREHEAGAR